MIVDRDTQHDGAPLSVYGTIAILVYLAEKTGKLLPASGPTRAKIIEWLGTISSDVGPAYSGQFVFNVLAKEKQPWAIDYYNKLCARMLQPIEKQLARTRFLAGTDYSIADVMAYPVATVSALRYPGSLSEHPNMARWAQEIGVRPAVQRGMKVPS